ncbi:MAG: adenosine-specific kinase [bacterium]|nr:adenosine-specific kinase [bacterium]
MNLECVTVEKPESVNFILGQSHFIKTVEDVHETLVQAVPGIRFGLAFCEASGPRLLRLSGTCPEMTRLAETNLLRIGAGHAFIVFLGNVFPVSVLPALRQIPEICRIFCATANPTDVIVAQNERGRGILGVIDGQPPLGTEKPEDVRNRMEFLRKIGYKLA